MYEKYVSYSQVHFFKNFSFGNDLIIRADVSYLYTENKKIFDLTGGIGVLNHGHNNSKILEQRIRFQNYPFIAAIINLAHGANRHDALLFAAAQLFHAGKFKLDFIKDIKNSLDNSGEDKIDEERYKEVIVTNKA